jgi:hypothetical protein
MSSSLTTHPYPVHDLWKASHMQSKHAYTSNQSTFIKDLLPEVAIEMPVFEVLSLLEAKFGSQKLANALKFEQNFESPLINHSDSSWLKKARMVGINVRTIGNFFNIIKYLLTIGQNQDSIHILPIWEPGVVASLYGKVSWNINTEFFSEELFRVIPTLDTAEKQLIVTVNLIHMMGKTVGLDVIPHTDRFSELVFVHPKMFEWVHRLDASILSVNGTNAEKVESVIWDFLIEKGSADGSNLAYSKEVFFNASNPILSEEQKLRVLFGKIQDKEHRLDRRLQLMQAVLYAGYETLPVTMAPPYRGLQITENDYIVDKLGNKWYNYTFIKPEKMSRVFGPLTRYKLFESDNEQNLQFDKPITQTWDYLCKAYYTCQKTYNFDFMRGDMAHVQPRIAGVPSTLPMYYDPLHAIKTYIQKHGKPYFAFFAETFLAPENTMGYGKEESHLEAIEADSTLGDLQGCEVGSNVFMRELEKYLNISENLSFVPNFTMITADKDDPRFDSFYTHGNHLRYFIGTFFNTLPSYMSLGFECRNTHITRGLNEEYSKLYVFQIDDKEEIDKVIHGPFVWGKNYALFAEFQKMKSVADNLLPIIDEQKSVLLSSIGGNNFTLAWQRGEYVFLCCLNPDLGLQIPQGLILKEENLIYSSASYLPNHICQIFQK